MNTTDYRAPGIYIKSLESFEQEPLISSVAGFVGVAERGPFNIPQTLRSWGEFTKIFGGSLPYSYLADSVYGFFLNGGEQCSVVRTGGDREQTSSRENNAPGTGIPADPLRKARNRDTITDANDEETIRITAINEGGWGNEIQVGISSESSGFIPVARLSVPNQLPLNNTIAVDRIYDFEAGGTIIITDKNDPFIKTITTIESIDATNSTVALHDTLTAVFPSGSIVSGKGFQISIVNKDRRETFDNLSMNPEHPRYFVDVINGSPDLVSYLDKERSGHSILITVEHRFDPVTGRSGCKPKSKPNDADHEPYTLAGGGDGFTHARGVLLDSFGNDSILVYAKKKGRGGNELRVVVSPCETRAALPVPGGNTLTLESASDLYPNDDIRITDAAPSANTETAEIESIAGESNEITLTGDLAHDYAWKSTVAVIDRFTITVRQKQKEIAEQRYFNLSMDPSSARYFKSVVNSIPDGSIWVEEAGTGITLPDFNDDQPLLLDQGKDPSELDERNYTGYNADGTYFKPAGAAGEAVGLATLEAVDDVSLVAVPDLFWSAPSLDSAYLAGQKKILLHCQKMGDRFGLLDAGPGTDESDMLTRSSHLADTDPARFGALYYPWLTISVEGGLKTVPPSGFIAGIIAQTDRREGVNKAPANKKLRGVIDLEKHIAEETQNEMNVRGINCCRKFEDGAIKIWGARTLSSDENGIYINVRRVMLMLVKVLSRKLLWTVFEPNDRNLWKRIETALQAFLQDLMAKGMLAGSRPEDAFFARCDETTTSPELMETASVVAEIGVALVAPAEFIGITIRRTAETLSVIEEDV